MQRMEAENPSQRRKQQNIMKLQIEMHSLTFNVTLFAISQHNLQYRNIICDIATIIVISQIKKKKPFSLRRGTDECGKCVGKIVQFGNKGELSMSLGDRTEKIPILLQS